MDEWIDAFRDGFLTTVSLSASAMVGAALVGLVVGLLRVSPVPILQKGMAAMTECVRNTPLTVLFVLFYFGLPKIGIRFEPFPSSVIVLSIYMGFLLAETLRSGIESVPKGQIEAARALGLSYMQVEIRIVLPYALRTVVAPAGALAIDLAKNSSIAYTISLVELTGTAAQLTTSTARPVPAFLGAAVLYVVITLLIGTAFSLLERKVNRHR
jgi:glutamate transport system permease protein